MQKQAPSLGRLVTMVAFALSCFGLLLFLWLSFGGAVPFKSQGYRVQVSFPEAAQLAIEADVRISGVPVGKVRGKERDPDGNGTIAIIELDPDYVPLRADTRAILREKTILGETYIELTPGSSGSPIIPDGGEIRNVQDTVQFDEFLGSFDPFTRAAFRTWQQSLAVAFKDRGQDLNDVFGNLPQFARNGADLLQTLDEERGALGQLVRNTGVTFEAITEREDQLRNLITAQDRVFTAIDRERDAFAETWRIFPTFLEESRLTFDRLRTFSVSARPVIDDLDVAARDLGPTLRSLGALGPDLENLFRNLDPLIDLSRRSLPATREVLEGLRPLLGELGPWLQEFNPLIDWVAEQQRTLADMFGNLGVATTPRTQSGDPNATGHYLRQFGTTGLESLALFPNRLATNRGNAYFNPGALVHPRNPLFSTLPAWDCENAGGEKPPTDTPGCHVQAQYPYEGETRPFPVITRDNYRRSTDDPRAPGQRTEQPPETGQ